MIVVSILIMPDMANISTQKRPEAVVDQKHATQDPCIKDNAREVQDKYIPSRKATVCTNTTLNKMPSYNITKTPAADPGPFTMDN
jgi:hypothetical protein